MDSLRHVLPLFIPIVAIVMGIGIGMLALWIDSERKRRLIDMLHKERMFALERGLEVPALPPELLGTEKTKEERYGLPRVSSLRWGLMWLLLGVALFTAMALNDGVQQASWALLLVAVGVAQLIHYQAAVAHARASMPPANTPVNNG